MYPLSSWGTETYRFAMYEQISFAVTVIQDEYTDLLSDTLGIPSLVAALSASIIVIHSFINSSIYTRARACFLSEALVVAETDTKPRRSGIRIHINSLGGNAIFGYQVARLVGCLVLTGLSTYSSISRPGFRRGILDLAMPVTYLYASFLATVVVSSSPRWSSIALVHMNFLLVSTFGVFFYRDIFPLATYTQIPLDSLEGSLLWIKIFFLTLTSVLIPLLVPRRYIPVDPNDPLEIPNPEQTASLLSLIVYSFLDPLVFLACKIPHLSHDQLPPLSDYDYAKKLKADSFPYIDPFVAGRKQHLLWGLLRTFRREYMILAVMLFTTAAASFVSPIGIKQLLLYIETRGENATIRPWFWIIWLFFGPVLGSLAWQWYIFIATRTLVRAEGIITQLIFEHSLRIRVKAETEAGAPSTSTGPFTPIASDIDSITSTLPPDDDGGVVSHSSELTGSSEADTLHSPDTHRASPSSIECSSSKKGKEKITKSVEESEREGISSAENLVGKITNLVTTDMNNITESRDFLLVLIYIPLQIILCIIFLYLVLGWSAFVGLVSIIMLFPIPGYVAKRIQDVQIVRLKATDARVQTVTETMNVLRMIKLFGWEKKMEQKIAEKREKELVWIWKRQILDMINGNLNFLIPIVTMIVTYSTYVGDNTIIMKQDLSASKVFSSMAVFDMLRDQLHMVFYSVTQVVTGKVSLNRVDDFLKNTELLDAFSEKDTVDLFPQEDRPSDDIGFHDATFVWSNDPVGSLTPSKRKFVLRIEDELIFQRGQINLIIGPTGSGKTSLLMALLGEMHFTPSHPHSWYNLPRDKGVAYAAQESWVQNETIKQNILFGAPFEEERYKKVLYQCSLERDLTLFDAGDETEVGEKGLTLSGGQKARITLARAVYSQAKILLLDDVLAALDVHTAKWIVEKCFSGDLIQGRTILLVTHNVAMTRPIAGYVVSMAIDGTIHTRGTISDALSNDSSLARELTEEENMITKAETAVDSAPLVEETKSDGKLIVAEEIELGHISWAALKLYFSGLGGNNPILFFVIVMIGLVLCDLSNAIQTWYLGYWASQYENDNDLPSEVPVLFYLGVYAMLLLLAVVLYCSSYLMYIYGVIRASRSIHAQLLSSVLGTTLRWLDVTPTSRVIARCTQDVRAVDGQISNGLWWLAEMTITMLIKFGAVVLFTPAFLLPGVVVAILGGWTGQIYIAAQLSVKREMSNARAPVLGHFGAAIAGLTSIRAYGAQEAFRDESLQRINRYTRAARTFYNLNRWICVRIDAIGGSFAASLAAYLVYFQDQKASNTGFSINMAVGFSGMILWWVRVLNDFEVQGNSSLERIQGYVDIEQEPKPTKQGVPPAYWPSSGEIQVENLSARYALDGPAVLHDLSFQIKSGERVGVVGRTGSGKSSLTLSLLRCIYNEGNIFYDGLNIQDVNLEILRSHITIIPQIPELLSGTLRENIDPFDQYDDVTLNDALRAAGLFSLQSEMDEGRLTLDSPIASGGGNLSVGQRQILALARAIVRGSKLLILDEATSAIDYKTDSIIQTSLRKELRGDVTLITIAHRLQTIMDADKILVLDAGRIVEFDSPKELLKIPDGKLRTLVDESGDMDLLYAIAKEKAV
ncbi:ATP-binding cassette transporter abc4 [Termitomyces sp. T112]|nr:ATP-binding cassette transporter abc4 [Termitomyces sp. T112]